MTRHRVIEDKAIEWLIRREEPDWDVSDQAELESWLQQSVAHKAAFWRAEQGWREADRIRSVGAGDAERPSIRLAFVARWWPALAAASMIAVIGSAVTVSGLRHVFTPPQIARFDTPVGGRQTIPLSDGSKVELNTATAVRATIGGHGREIWLDSGEAYFEVVHDAGQPFVVHAGKQTITDLGTKFSVWRDGDRVTVNVLEGRVLVQDAAIPDGHAAIIAAGDTAVANGPSTLIKAKSEDRVESALAWRDGLLSFDQTPLSDAATEFNRYNRKPIVILSPDVSSIRIGGSFQASNVDAFARLLRDAYGLKVREDDDGVKISS